MGTFPRCHLHRRVSPWCIQTKPAIMARGTRDRSRVTGTILTLLSCLGLAASTFTTASPTVSGGNASPTTQTTVDNVVYNQWDSPGCGAAATLLRREITTDATSCAQVCNLEAACM